jgi:hypothetical protein
MPDVIAYMRGAFVPASTYPPRERLCEFVVRPSGGSFVAPLTLNYELPPEGRTTNIAFREVWYDSSNEVLNDVTYNCFSMNRSGPNRATSEDS